MIHHIKYALSKYTDWFSILATFGGVIAILSLEKWLAITIIVCCYTLAFLIPFVSSFLKKEFHIKTIGNSDVTVQFGDIFDEKCFMVTTNRHFDVDPNEGFIADSSLLGAFVNKFYPNNIGELKQTIRNNNGITLDGNNNINTVPYGKTILFQKNGKIIYLMAFTDRKKSKQPKDFYVKAVNGFLKEISEANHGKTIAICLLGDNNNLSNTGFASSEIAFKSLISMIDNFGIQNLQATLKLKIVILPDKRAELIEVISRYSKSIL